MRDQFYRTINRDKKKKKLLFKEPFYLNGTFFFYQLKYFLAIKELEYTHIHVLGTSLNGLVLVSPLVLPISLRLTKFSLSWV